MYDLNQIFAAGNWFAKEGKEEEFKAAWKTFADWSGRNRHGSGTPYLLHNLNNPRHFISFGPWPSTEAITEWRNTQEFKNFVDKAKELCDKFEPFTLKTVARGEE
jgi:heme-degrading monooxygenase HmoA